MIEVHVQVRTEKMASKRLIDIIKDTTTSGKYKIIVIQGNALEKAEELRKQLLYFGLGSDVSIATFASFIETNLGAGSIAKGYILND